jgi:hypothetical protein
MDERRSEKRDAMRERVSALHADLLVLREGDRDALELRKAVGALAVQARRADVPPERLLVVLKRLTDSLALAHLGLWHRLTLGERFVQWGIASYYQSDDSM